MKSHRFCWQGLLGSIVLLMSAATAEAKPKSFYDFKVNSIEGQVVDLSQMKGKTVLVVNTASRCGYTPQYQGLQKLYSKYQNKGLVILGFPSNDFGGQEPGKNQEIKRFCALNYGVQFPMFEKGPVSGANAQALFRWLTSQRASGVEGEVLWNFEKFLINSDGKLEKRFRSEVAPEDSGLLSAIEIQFSKKSNH